MRGILVHLSQDLVSFVSYSKYPKILIIGTDIEHSHSPIKNKEINITTEVWA